MIFNKMIISYYVWLAFGWLIIPVCADAGNIVYNPGFEDISSGNKIESVPDGWTVSPSNVFRHVVCSDYAHSGTNAVKLSENNQSISPIKRMTTNDYGSFAGKGIMLSAWALTPYSDPLTSAHGDVAIRFYTVFGTLCNPGEISAPVIDYQSEPGTWIYGSVSAVIPANCVELQLLLRRSSGISGTVYFDDITALIQPLDEFTAENVNLAEIPSFTPSADGEMWLRNTNISLNLLVNNGFEQDKGSHESKNGFPASGWGRWDTGPIGPKRSARYAHTGAYSALITRDNHTVFPYAKVLAIEYGRLAGKEVKVSAWAYTPGMNPLSNSVGKIALEFYTSDNKTCCPFRVWKPVLHESGLTNRWVYEELTAHIPPECSRVDMFLSKGYNGTVEDDIDAETYKQRYTCAGAVYFDDIELYVTGTGSGEEPRTAGDVPEERTWQIAGPFKISQAREYDSNYFQGVLECLPEPLPANAPYLAFNDLPVAQVEPNAYFLPHVMPFVAWSTNDTQGIVPGYLQLLSRWHAFPCTVTMPWESLKIEGKWQSRKFGMQRGMTNIYITYNPEARQAHETNGYIIVEFGRHGTFRVPVTCEMIDGQWRLKRTRFDTGEDTTALLPSYWRQVAANRESPAEVDTIGEHALVLAQCEWVSPVAQDAELRVGSDDALKVWHNSKNIFTYPHGRGYVKGRNVIPVRLTPGTNYFMFALVNGVGVANVGAELYPGRVPLEGQLRLLAGKPEEYDLKEEDSMKLIERFSAVNTGDVLTLDFYWQSAAGVSNKPVYLPYPVKPACEWIRILHSSETNYVLKGETGEYPLEITMHNKPNGVYVVETKWDGTVHRDYFMYFDPDVKFTDTQRWWIHLVSETRAEELFPLIERYRDDDEFVKLFHGTTVRAYRSAYDNTLQPYGISVPAALAGKTNSPLLVYLEADQTSAREDWSMKFPGRAVHNNECITVTPYARGGRPYNALGEKDVLAVIEEMARLYDIDRTRIYLEGECYGGVGCWELAAKYPDKFAAIIPYGDTPVALIRSGMFRNLVTVPLWHHHPEFFYPDMVQATVNALKLMGADARIDIHAGAGKGSYDQFVLKDMREWLLTKKLKNCPIKVYYRTYGDVAGAFWVRNIVPEQGYMPATVFAEVDTNAAGRCDNGIYTTNAPEITIKADNVARFELELVAGVFTNYPVWHITVNGTGPYRAESGRTTPIILDETVLAESATGLTKLDGLCGGLVSVVNDSFCIAYAADKDDNEPYTRAQQFYKNFVGTGFWKINGNFPLVADTNLTEEMCEKYNVILFASYTTPGTWLRTQADGLPFTLYDDHVVVGTRAGRDFMSVYPNPLATNRYVLTVPSTNLSARLLRTGHFDCLLDGVPGSFDYAWDTVHWADEGHSGHDHAHASNTGSGALKGEGYGINKESLWKRMGRIIVLIIGGCLVVYFAGRNVYERIRGER